MKRFACWCVWSAVAVVPAWSSAAEAEKDVSWRAQAEIARRGAFVERVAGMADGSDANAAIAAAMQPPADDSHKWCFTLVTTRGCQWCDLERRDFEQDPKLKAWVDTKDYAKSWAHWQVVQIEDQSQAWRWRDFRPTSFPAIIVQPPVNGSWGDAHTIVFAHQGYLKPADLDVAIRRAIQLYAAKVNPRRQMADSAALAPINTTGGHEQARQGDAGGGWTPPVTPPSPLPAPMPSPIAPNYPVVPPEYPPAQPNLGSLLGQLLASLLGGTATANLLLIAILAWQVYRGIARREGIPLLVDDAAAEKLVGLLESLPMLHSPASSPQTPAAGK
jgi:hypothetical protein